MRKSTSPIDVARLAFLLLVVCASVFCTTGCGGSLSAQRSSNATLVSLSLAPKSPSIVVSGTEQFTATANYSDGSTQSVTNSATWTSSDTSKASVQNTGVASGIAAGSSTITATYSGQSASTVLTITATNTL